MSDPKTGDPTDKLALARPDGRSRALTDSVDQIAQILLRKIDPALVGSSVDAISALVAHVGATGESATLPDVPVARWQDAVIEREMKQGASVLDLGCGGGELLARLMDSKQVRGQGVEIDPAAVMESVARGVPVFQTNLDEGLKGFPDHSFDYVVLEGTLQTLHRPMEILSEMLRVGRRGIVSFPNFGFWRVRIDLALRGRMPVTESLPSRWHDSPNIHLFTIQDFLDWTKESKVRVVSAFAHDRGAVRPLEPDDNLFAEDALMIVEKMSG